MATLTIADLDNGKRDLETVDAVANSQADTTTTRYGQQTLTLAEALRRLGWRAPVPYAPGLNVDSPVFTVEFGDPAVVYRPDPSIVPFTTAAWGPDQWRVVQNTNDTDLVYQFPTLGAAETAAATLPEGSSVIVEGETQGHVILGAYVPDSGVPAHTMQGYSALQGYSGKQKLIRITSQGIAGIFEYGPTLPNTSNGGTRFAHASGTGAWRRIFDGALMASWFGVKSGVPSADAIQAAINEIPFGGVILFGRGNFILEKTIDWTSLGVTLQGENYGSILTVTHNGDVFRFTNQMSRFKGFEIQIGVSTNRSGSSVWNVLAGAHTGYIEDVRITGGATTVNNGMIFREDTHLAGNWNLNRIQISGGVTWTSFVRLSADATLGTCASHWISNIACTRVKVLAALYDFEGAIDTVSGVAAGGDVVGGPVIWTHTPRPTEEYYYPRWIHFSNSFCEAWSSHSGPYTIGSTVACLQLDSCRDFRWVNGYLGSASYGAAIGPGAFGVTIADSQFINLGRSAATIAAGAIGVRIHHNSVNDVCAAADGAHNAFDVGAGASDFEISSNDLSNTYENKPFYWINIQNGASDRFSIVGNASRTPAVAGMMLNGAAGVTTNWRVSDNWSL